jgi:hypothetical protein
MRFRRRRDTPETGQALLVFVPVLGSALVHAPVLTFDLFKPLKQPLDLGLSIGGTRVFGANKTLRGALFMTAGPVVASVALSRVPAYWDRLPRPVRDAGPVDLGLRLGAAVVLGELPNSFAKRRLGIAPGSRKRTPAGVAITVLDQGDFVPAVWLALRPRWRMPPRDAAVALAAVSLSHLAIGYVGYLVGARNEPL